MIVERTEKVRVKIMDRKWLGLGLIILDLGSYLFWALDSVGRASRDLLQKRLLENKDAVADILPPPFYVIESFLHMNHYFHDENSAERIQHFKAINEARDACPFR